MWGIFPRAVGSQGVLPLGIHEWGHARDCDYFHDRLLAPRAGVAGLASSRRVLV
jgi:hypothetical protein